jgi:hypothetical protein
MRKRWTNHEMKRLVILFPAATDNELLAAFPGRTIDAIRHCANLHKIYRAYKPVDPAKPNRYLEYAKAHRPAFNFGAGS